MFDQLVKFVVGVPGFFWGFGDERGWGPVVSDGGDENPGAIFQAFLLTEELATTVKVVELVK